MRAHTSASTAAASVGAAPAAAAAEEEEEEEEEAAEEEEAGADAAAAEDRSDIQGTIRRFDSQFSVSVNIQKQMKVQVRCATGQRFDVECAPTATVAELKALCEPHSGVAPAAAKIIHKGRILRDETTLSANG
jgi:hypothetical protein